MVVYNNIEILAPRWRDRTVLVGDWKIGWHNRIVIKAAKKDGTLYYPEPLYMSGDRLKTYPVESHVNGLYRRRVPIADFITIQEFESNGNVDIIRR